MANPDDERGVDRGKRMYVVVFILTNTLQRFMFVPADIKAVFSYVVHSYLPTYLPTCIMVICLG